MDNSAKLIVGGLVGVSLLDFAIRKEKSLIGQMTGGSQQRNLMPSYQSQGYSSGQQNQQQQYEYNGETIPTGTQKVQKDGQLIKNIFEAVTNLASKSKKNGVFPLKRGSTGQEVAMLQRHLGITPSGKFDANTKKVLKNTYGITSINSQAEFSRMLGVKSYTPDPIATKQPIVNLFNPYEITARNLWNERYQFNVGKDRWELRNPSSVSRANVNAALGSKKNSKAAMALVAQAYREMAGDWGVNTTFSKDFKGIV